LLPSSPFCGSFNLNLFKKPLLTPKKPSDSVMIRKLVRMLIVKHISKIIDFT